MAAGIQVMGHEELERRDDCATNQKYGQRVIERSDYYTLSIPPALHLSKSERFSRVPPLVSQMLVTCRVTGHVSFHGSPTRTGPTEHYEICVLCSGSKCMLTYRYCSGFENRNNSAPFKKVKNLQMEADRLELIARHNFAPSNQARLFARPMRVQIVLGARLYPAWFTHGRWPVPFRAAGLRGRRNRRWPGSVAFGDICIHV